MAGMDGWNVIGVVPRTTGIGLSNSSIGSTMGTSWGAGLGGNVIGVYLLLNREVTDNDDISALALEVAKSF
jgi:hypothetical protein